MTRYLVFEPPEAGAPPRSRSERAVFVRDGFAGWAFLFPGFWLLRHGLVVWGILALAATAALGRLGERPGLLLAAAALSLLLGLLAGFEGPSLRAARYRRKGYRETAVLDAGDADDAAVLYYAGPAEPQPAQDAAPPSQRPASGTAPAVRPRSLLDPQGHR